MASAKKTPAKKASPRLLEAKKPAAKAKAPAASKTAPETKYPMPVEVSEWIEQAMSRMRNMQAKIDRLEEENKKLKAWRKWAEQRILGSSHE